MNFLKSITNPNLIEENIKIKTISSQINVDFQIDFKLKDENQKFTFKEILKKSEKYDSKMKYLLKEIEILEYCNSVKCYVNLNLNICNVIFSLDKINEYNLKKYGIISLIFRGK